MKLRLYALAAVLGLAPVSLLAVNSLPKAGLAGSLHDIGGNGCRSCHAPHNGSTANGGTQTTGLIMLWTRNFPAAANTFGVYSSATMGNTATELGGSALSTSADSRMYSLLCLSCHDGVTSAATAAGGGATLTANMVGSKASFGTGAYESLGLTNDHPVNMTYNPAASLNDSLQTVATVTATLPLYGSTNTMQCGTCHDSHNNVNTKFLRTPNTTAHCTTCHL